MAQSPKSTSPDSPSKARELTGTILNFIATANNETLGACIVGLCAVTYLILGRVGLLLIGAVGGIVIHAAWEGERGRTPHDGVAEVNRRREVGLDIVKRLLDARNQDGGDREGDKEGKAELEVAMASHKELNFDDFQPETRAALESLVDAVIRDYVKWWYSPILPDDSTFPYECRQTLTSFLLAAASHISRKRPADTFLNFLTNSTSIIIVFLSELSNALMVPGLQETNVAEIIRAYLEEKPDSNLANVLNREQQDKKFKMVADDVLQTFLDSKAYNCGPVMVFLREVLAGLIFEGTLRTCSKQDWINGWIVYLLEEGESEIINVIDAGVGSATGKAVSKATPPQDVQKDSEATAEKVGHKRSSSKAEQAMEEAMLEAKRLSELIAEEDAKKSLEVEDTSSSVSTEQAATPTSSQSDLQAAAPDAQQVAEASAAVNHEFVADNAPLATRAFTSFDQILPPLPASPETSEPAPLTLHKASVAIFDDSQPGEKGNIRSKPIIDYLLQIEPASSQHRGWMTARKYSEFETLHEVLRRISIISGVPEFAQKHGSLPAWKSQTKASLRAELEGYLRDALHSEPLAESEGMKRFLEKEQAVGRPTQSKGVLGFPNPEAFQSMGKGMLDVLTSAPKGAAGGGKALFTGVSGVFSGPKRTPTGAHPREVARSESGSAGPHTSDGSSAIVSMSSIPSRPSQDSFSNPFTDHNKGPPPLPERPGVGIADLGILSVDDTTQAWGSPNSSLVDVSLPGSQASGLSSLLNSDLQVRLPPPPSEIADDYSSLDHSTQASSSFHDTIPTPASLHNLSQVSYPPPEQEIPASSSNPHVSAENPSTNTAVTSASTETATETSPTTKPKPATLAPRTPLTEQEAQVAIELIFAVINELYTLSSAWNIRRTLLNAAKTFLLRPGNPSLESIRALLQETTITANTTDAGLALRLRKLRENSLPTEDELKTWPAPLTRDESDALRSQARKLLVGKGMPAALTSVMGAAASGEALGRVFDSLQVEEVARGLFFAMLLQGVRAVTH